MTNSNSEHQENAQLLRRLHALPRSLEPSRELWPEVQSRLDSRPERAVSSRQPYWTALAACLTLVVIAGLMLGRDHSPSVDQRSLAKMPFSMTDPELTHPALSAALQASEKEYQAALQSMLPLNPVSSSSLSLKGAELWRSWAAMQQTEANLVAALSEYPGNTFLGQKLVDLRGQQLAFIRQVYRLEKDNRRTT